MATGKKSYFDLECSSNLFQLRVNWSETYDASTNSSIVKIESVQIKSTGWYGITYFPDGAIKINGQTVIQMSSNMGHYGARPPALDEWATIKIIDDDVPVTGQAVVIHNADGTGTAKIEIAGNNYSKCYFYTIAGGDKYGNGWSCTGSQTVELTQIATYTLSISAGAGSSITVRRTSSGYADTGNISSGARLYYGDMLRISFAPHTNYRLVSTTVNGSSFTSGNTHTVNGNVDVKSTAQVLASQAGATDANVGSTSTITITKYNTSYCHSLQYSFGNLSGYITSSGGIQSTEEKFESTGVAFSVPESFYSQIPNAKSGKCTITCRTYANTSSTDILGSPTTCKFMVTTKVSVCQPTVAATIKDVNSVTVALTGDDSVLIKHCSTAQCSIYATPKYSSTINSLKIGGYAVQGTETNGSVVGVRAFANVDKTSFSFDATDSRGYTATQSVSPTVIPYVVLTCNPTISRPTPTGTFMTMRITGNVFSGSFGAYTNTMTVKYRYKQEGGSYSSWKTLDPACIIYGTNNYRTDGFITLPDEFDYKKSYVFQVRATDGAEGYVLTTAQSTIPVQRGVPVFDWSSDDFNINVTLKLDNTRIMDIIYPVGSVYMHRYSDLPEVISNIGVWENMNSGIDSVYAWVRTE